MHTGIISYIIRQDPQTTIWELMREGNTPKAYCGNPDGGNVQALLYVAIGVQRWEPFYLEVIPA